MDSSARGGRPEKGSSNFYYPPCAPARNRTSITRSAILCPIRSDAPPRGGGGRSPVPPTAKRGGASGLNSVWCLREESNLDYKIRNLVSYPLNDEGSLFHLDISFPNYFFNIIFPF